MRHIGHKSTKNMRHFITFFIFLTYSAENVWWFQGKTLFLQQFPKTGSNKIENRKQTLWQIKQNKVAKPTSFQL